MPVSLSLVGVGQHGCNRDWLNRAQQGLQVVCGIIYRLENAFSPCQVLATSQFRSFPWYRRVCSPLCLEACCVCGYRHLAFGPSRLSRAGRGVVDRLGNVVWGRQAHVRTWFTHVCRVTLARVCFQSRYRHRKIRNALLHTIT